MKIHILSHIQKEQYDELNKIAKEKGMSVSGLVSDIVNEWLNHRRKKKNTPNLFEEKLFLRIEELFLWLLYQDTPPDNWDKKLQRELERSITRRKCRIGNEPLL